MYGSVGPVDNGRSQVIFFLSFLFFADRFVNFHFMFWQVVFVYSFDYIWLD